LYSYGICFHQKSNKYLTFLKAADVWFNLTNRILTSLAADCCTFFHQKPTKLQFGQCWGTSFMGIFISNTTITIFMWYQNQRDTMNVTTKKFKSTWEGTKKLVRYSWGFKVTLLQLLNIIKVPHSSGHTIKANDKEKKW
jgi:hypothetical protein